MKKYIALIVILLLIIALINQIFGDNLSMTVALLWFSHTIRFIDDFNKY